MTEGADPFYEHQSSEKNEKRFEIRTDGIFKEYDPADIKIFVDDLFLVFTLLTFIDKDYGRSDENLVGKEISKFKKLISDWNKKYRNVIFKFYVDGIKCSIKVYLAGIDMNTMRSLLKKMYGFISMNFTENLVEALFEEDENENSLTLKKENNEMELIYHEEDMQNPRSPEFRLCAYFAMWGGFNKKFDLSSYANEFSFDLESDEPEGGNWYKRFPNIRFRRWGGSK